MRALGKRKLRPRKIVLMSITEPSLEALGETGILPGSIFHPADLEVSKELAALCCIGQKSHVLDVTCGTGETACFFQTARSIPFSVSAPFVISTLAKP